MKTTTLKNRTKKIALIIMLFAGVTFANSGFSQYYDITGTWSSTSGNAFTVKYTYDYSGDITGIKVVNLTKGKVFYYDKLWPTVYYRTYYDGCVLKYSFITVSNCFNIKYTADNSTHYWEKD